MDQTDLIVYCYGKELRLHVTPFNWLSISLKEDGLETTRYQQYDNTVTTSEAIMDFLYRLDHGMLDGKLVGK